jgi:Ulp1 family protease
VQQQPNFSDCGIYLLQYVESFFRNPITDYTLPITSLKAWFPEEEVPYSYSNLVIYSHSFLLTALPEKCG